jgi:uroporphyrinogen decarboxylase
MQARPTKRELVSQALAFRDVPYVPWQFDFTLEARETLLAHYGTVAALDDALQNHILPLGNAVGFFHDIGNDRVRDGFGVVWDRSTDKDIGIVEGAVLPDPSLTGYTFPDPLDERFFEGIPAAIEAHPDRFRVFQIGFSLYERAWTLRGMDNLLADFYENPAFVHGLLDAIADYNIAQARKALEYDIDGVYFGDDWGSQAGVQMGIDLWREFLKPPLARMYGEVRAAGKPVFIHSCGAVDALFDDLVEIGVNCFNPFQPEVMDIAALHERYHGRLAFHGGLSTQQTLPYGSAAEVIEETQQLIRLGMRGGYLLAPAHAVEGDVPLENMLAFIETAKAQHGFAP